MQRKITEKEFLVCGTLHALGYKPKENAAIKMNSWSIQYAIPDQAQVDLTKDWLAKFDIVQVDPNDMTSAPEFDIKGHDILVDGPIIFSLKHADAFNNPSPGKLADQAALDDTGYSSFVAQYTDIEETWYDEINATHGGRFPLKMDKTPQYDIINNLAVTYMEMCSAAINLVKYIMKNENKYVIKYNKASVFIYKLGVDTDKYTAIARTTAGATLTLYLQHKTKKIEPIQLRLALKNTEPFTKRSTKTLPLKYTVSVRNMDRFRVMVVKRSTSQTENVDLS